MFADFYKMCEEYWTPDGSDEYWQAIIKTTDDFVEKYKGLHPIASEMACAFVCGMEKKHREVRGK